MKTIFYTLILIALFTGCSKNSDTPDDNQKIPEGDYIGYFDYHDTLYWYAVSIDGNMYTEWPSGGAYYQKSFSCLTVGTYSLKGDIVTFYPDSFKFEGFPEMCNSDMVLQGEFIVDEKMDTDSLIFNRNLNTNGIKYYLQRY